MKATVRSFGRARALDGLAATYRWSNREEEGLQRPRVSLPYLHAVPPHEEDMFRRFIDRLAANHTFIGYTEAVERIRSGEIDKPYVSFSFDDGFVSNVRCAQILEEYGATGMFFVPTGFIGTPTVSQARDFFGFSDGCDEPAMTWDDLESMKARGHEIGNHTQSHRIVANLSAQERYDEVAGAAEVLRSRLGESRHFAWPYGRFFHFTDDAARAVFESGHDSCASAERGAHVSQADQAEPLCLRRDHIMTSWPARHSIYFIAHSGLKATDRSNDWPADWSVT